MKVSKELVKKVELKIQEIFPEIRRINGEMVYKVLKVGKDHNSHTLITFIDDNFAVCIYNEGLERYIRDCRKHGEYAYASMIESGQTNFFHDSSSYILYVIREDESLFLYGKRTQ